MKKQLAKASAVALLTLSMTATAIMPVTAAKPAGAPTAFKAVDDANLNTTGKLPLLKDKVTLSVGMVQNAMVQDYDTNEFTKWIEETVNVDLKFDLYPSKDAQTKVRVMISSGSKLPDIFTGMNFSDFDVLTYGSEKSIIALNDYINTYGVNSKKIYEKSPFYKAMMTSADGNIYSMPKLVESTPNEWSSRAWINKIWLDKLGLKMPKTTDDFYKLLKEMKEKDPNGNKLADEIPLIGSTNGWRQQVYQFIMNSFIYTDVDQGANHFTVNNGKIDVPYNKAEWRDGLIYMAKLSSEKLLSPLSFTQDSAQLDAIVRNKETALVGVVTSGNSSTMGDRVLEYWPMPPLTGPKGVSYATYTPSLPSNNYLISKDCKTPLAAFMVADAMLSEESAYRSRFGVPEKDWKKASPNDKSMLDEMGFKPVVTPILNWGKVQNSHWQETSVSYRTYELTNGQVWDGDPMNSQYLVTQAVPVYYGKSPKEVVSKLIFTLKESEEVKDLQTTITGYVSENTARFITGDKKADGADWDKYIKELETMGLKRYIQLCQTAYDRMNKK